MFNSGSRNLANGTTQSNPTDWGDIRWGSSSSPHPTANVYDGAWRTWFYSVQYSTLATTNFKNVAIWAFNANCATSCGGGLRLDLDTSASTPYAYSARVAHELGHVVSSQTSQEKFSHPCVDYGYKGTGGWSITSPEWSCAGFEEAYATFIGDVGRYWWNAPQPIACAYETGTCSLSMEASSGVGTLCPTASEEDRWVLSSLRALWDIYDSAQDPGAAETISEPYNLIVDNNNHFTVGTANRQRDEPSRAPVAPWPTATAGRRTTSCSCTSSTTRWNWSGRHQLLRTGGLAGVTRRGLGLLLALVVVGAGLGLGARRWWQARATVATPVAVGISPRPAVRAPRARTRPLRTC